MTALLERLRIAGDHVARDTTHAWRALRRAPTFTVVVALTLAIGIGANAAVLGVIDTAFLRKLPVPAPERIVKLYVGTARRAQNSWLSIADWKELRTSVQGVDGLAMFAMDNVRFGDDLAGQTAWSAFVSGDYFHVLGIRAQRGRLIAPDEEQPSGAHPVVVISNTVWRELFGADEQVIGRQVTLGSTRFTIVGVAPAGFTGLHPEGRTDLWIPYTMKHAATGSDFEYTNRDVRQVEVFGRLKSEGSLVTVRTSLDNAARDLAAKRPAGERTIAFQAAVRPTLVSAEEAPAALTAFLTALLMVALVQMVACANIASLLLSRAAARRQELGIRLCLGASRARIVLQSLAESGLLALLGAVGGVLIARWLMGLLTSMEFMSAMRPALDARTVAIVVVIATVTTFQFGLLPALASSRHDPMHVLRASAGATTGARSAGSLLIVSQVAISFILLAQASVQLGKYRRESAMALGYDSPRLVAARIQPRETLAAGDWAQLSEMATARVSALPGAARVALVSSGPLMPGGSFDEVTVPDHEYASSDPRQFIVRPIGPDYFATIGARLLQGREFASSDRLDAGARHGAYDVAIVNEAFARKFWPHLDPIGRLVKHRKGVARVVGVVADIRDVTVGSTAPSVYFPLLESPANNFTMMVRVQGDLAGATSRIRGALASMPGIKPPYVRAMESVRGDATQLPRILGIALSVLSGIALLLTAIGLYGGVATWAATRRKEIGIRLALGASASHVYSILLSSAGKLLAAGAIAGSLAAVAVVRLQQSRFGSTLVLDAGPAMSAILIFAVVMGVAAWLPARRSTKLPPAEVLRSS